MGEGGTERVREGGGEGGQRESEERMGRSRAQGAPCANAQGKSTNTTLWGKGGRCCSSSHWYNSLPDSSTFRRGTAEAHAKHQGTKIALGQQRAPTRPQQQKRLAAFSGHMYKYRGKLLPASLPPTALSLSLLASSPSSHAPPFAPPKKMYAILPQPPTTVLPPTRQYRGPTRQGSEARAEVEVGEGTQGRMLNTAQACER